MKPAERRAWILAWIRRREALHGQQERVDVTYSDFVIDYIEATDAKHEVLFMGAPRCPQLGRDLGAMYAAGILERHTTGLEGMAGMGFPRWVWVYYLPRKKEQA